MTSKPVLIIGNKNYSSWSLRPWLALRHFEVEFDEIRLPLGTSQFNDDIYRYSPSGKVPALVHGDLYIWDSLAILEYANETLLAGKGWPNTVTARATARAISAEMHSGFTELRANLPMNCRKRLKNFPISAAVEKDVNRICEIWNVTRKKFGSNGPYLLGEFSTADAMYAPVVLRFTSYAVTIPKEAQQYCDAILALPAMKSWLAEAALETEVISKYERDI